MALRRHKRGKSATPHERKKVKGKNHTKPGARTANPRREPHTSCLVLRPEHILPIFFFCKILREKRKKTGKPREGSDQPASIARCHSERRPNQVLVLLLLLLAGMQATGRRGSEASSSGRRETGEHRESRGSSRAERSRRGHEHGRHDRDRIRSPQCPSRGL